MNKWFSAVVLLLISASAWASGTDVSHTISDPAVTNHTDLSIAYLAQVFGNVGTVLHGTSGQMLGKMFYKFNEGVLIVSGIWLSYTTSTIVLRSAQEGSFMGASKNVALIFIRISLGLGLMFPNPTTGYSIFQDITMKVVVQGVALADETWSYALQYINNGGTLWQQPTKSQVELLKNVLAAPSSPENPGAGYPGQFSVIFQNEVCMVAASMVPQTTDNSAAPQTGIANTGTNKYNTYKVTYDAKNGTASFGGPGGAAGCGSIDFSNLLSDGSVGYNAVKTSVDNLMPAAKRYACQNYASGDSTAPVCAGVDTTESSSEVPGEAFFSALVNYTNDIYPLAQLKADGASNAAKGFIATAEKEGWMMAGRYYWDLSAISSRNQAAGQLATYLPSVKPKDSSSLSATTDPLTKFLQNVRDDASNYAGQAMTKLHAYMNASNAGNAVDGSTTDAGNETIGGSVVGAAIAGVAVFGPIALALLPIIIDTAELFTSFSTTSSAGIGHDPILFLHNVGMHCVAIAGDVFILAGVFMGIMLITTMFCQSMINLATPIKGIVDWLKIPLMMMGSAFLGVGVMLGYFVPMYPYLLFIFGVIGWIIAVIEAMVAAPLVCLGLTHPEGHDFLGEAKQALMLLLGVFLRPVLMVIGLVAAMILSYVSLRIIIYTFSGFMSDIFYITGPATGSASGNLYTSIGSAMGNYMATSGSLTGIIFALLLAPVFYIIFTGIVYVVTTHCFSLIYVLPDYILRWIGGPQSSTGFNPMQMAGQVQGPVGTAGQQLGKANADSAGQFQDKSSAKLGELANKKGGEATGKLSSPPEGDDASAAQDSGGSAQPSSAGS